MNKDLEMQELYDRLTSLWQEAEQELKAILCPIDIVIGCDSARTGVKLSWCRYENSRRICWESSEYTRRPLLESPITARLEMIDYYQSLKATVKENTCEFKNELIAGIEKFEGILSP